MKKVLFWMLLLLVLGAAGVKAQVRIGGNAAPNAGAVLDLNPSDATTGTQGLALPRVNLTSNTMQLASGVTNLTGMLVYNTTATLGTGIYFWNGSNWIIISGDGVVGNELTDTIAGGGLNKIGAGTAVSPYKVGIAPGGVQYSMLTAAGTIDRSVLQYSGGAWHPAILLKVVSSRVRTITSPSPGANYTLSYGDLDTASTCVGSISRWVMPNAFLGTWVWRFDGNNVYLWNPAAEGALDIRYTLFCSFQ